MKLIIDIPDEEYKTLSVLSEKEKVNELSYYERVIAKGIPYEERPQGEWIVTAEDNHGVHRICCPFCSYEKGSNNTDPIIVTFSNFPKFCENCGADMRGEEK